MGTIRKRNGRYQVQIRRAGLPLMTRTFQRKTDADAWIRLIEGQIDYGELPASPKLIDQYTFKSILERYRDEISVKKARHKTEIGSLNALLRHRISSTPLSRLTLSDFLAYRTERLKSVKPNTANSQMTLIKSVFETAIRDWGVPLRENPLLRLKKLKFDDARTRRLSKEEMTALVKASEETSNPFTLLFVRFALATAMRRSEIARARWSDVDFSYRILFIPITKNGESRTIPLSPEALDVLEDVKRLKAHDTVRIFPISNNAFKLSWQRLVKRAGVQDLRFHDCRHEAISRFFEIGLSVPEVALISGHKDLKMLFRYTHLKAKDVAIKLNKQQGGF